MRLIMRNFEKEIRSLSRSKCDLISLNTGLFFRWVSQPLRSAQETGKEFQSYSWHISTELLKVGCPGILLRAIWHFGLRGEDSQAPAQKPFKYLMFVETNTRQLYSLGQNFVGFVLDWGRTRFGDEWQLYFGWEIGSQVFGILPILCK